MRKSGEVYRVSGNLENTYKITRDTFWVGVYPGTTEEMIEFIIETIKYFTDE